MHSISPSTREGTGATDASPRGEGVPDDPFLHPGPAHLSVPQASLELDRHVSRWRCP